MFLCGPLTVSRIELQRIKPLLETKRGPPNGWPKVPPEFRRPAVRAVAARLAVARWIVVAVVLASALEPVSLHFRQAWKALLLKKINGMHKYGQECSQSVRCLT